MVDRFWHAQRAEVFGGPRLDAGWTPNQAGEQHGRHAASFDACIASAIEDHVSFH